VVIIRQQALVGLHYESETFSRDDRTRKCGDDRFGWRGVTPGLLVRLARAPETAEGLESLARLTVQGNQCPGP
jgi:hypothetical protein